MSFTPETSLDSMRRLGRKKGLLQRGSLENGNSLLGRTLSFINSKKDTGGLLTIIGHPSAGKTTEFNRIARDLSSNDIFSKSFLPLYTELQNAEIADVEFDSKFIWDSIVSGCIDIELHGEKLSKSLESYCAHCREIGRAPILLIDTLDILMLHQVNEKDIDVAKLWANFLQSVVGNNVVLVWTCRPFEWKYFQREIGIKFESLIEVLELPSLEKSQIKPFTDINDLTIQPIQELTEDWSEKDAWREWTINFQANMPIFADRWSDYTKKSKKLDNDLFSKFATDFRNFTSTEIDGKHWFQFIKELPSQYLYTWLWSRITDRLVESYKFNLETVESLRRVLEKEAKSTAMNLSDSTSRVRLEYSKLLHSMIEECNIDEVSASQFFVVSESRGLLTRSGIWIDFTHQLLFEEALLRDSTDDELYKLQKFPSILLRSKTRVGSFSQADEILQDEVLNAIGNWTGFMLSHHPKCISQYSNLDQTWDKWVDYAQDNELYVSLKVPELEFNEFTEKRIALRKYQKSDGLKSLLVNGAPGTGKTYFCRDYLKWALAKNRIANKPIKWRYYTLNNHLAEHFDDLVNDDEWVGAIPEYKLDLRRSTGGSFSIDRLLRYINPEINRNKGIKDSRGIGLLTFSIFKVLVRQYFAQTNVEHSGAKCPPLADSWQIYNQVIHDPISGNRRQIANREQFNDLNSQSYKMKSKAIDWFLKFHNELKNKWWTYSYAAFDCRQKISTLDSENSDSIRSQIKVAESEGDHSKASRLRRNMRETFEVDLLIVDEVQDINPPVMALLLELMRPGFKSHSIMIAGDMIQTVNRSGFNWIDFSNSTAASMKDSKHPEKFKLIHFGVFDENELKTHMSTLKYVWRNGKRLVQFNNKLRSNYAESFGISEYYSSRFDYPGGELLFSANSKQKDEDSKITILETESLHDYDQLIHNLSEVSNKLAGDDVAVLAPFEIEEEWNNIFKFPVYDAESVKGLEFESIVVLMPYMIPEIEARSSLIRNLGETESEIQNQIQKWCNSWKENTQDASHKNFENFNQLFLNVMTRMNVLFSRPEKRILIISPVSFGRGVQLFDMKNDNQTMVSFGIPKIPQDVDLDCRGKNSMLETLYVELRETEDKNISYKKLLSKALSQAGLNIDGTQKDNERKVWDNLWHNVKDNHSAPLKAIAYAGGLEYQNNIDCMRLLRADLGRGFILNQSNIRNPENQIISALYQGKTYPGITKPLPTQLLDESLSIAPTMAHYIFANLESLIRKAMDDSHDHEKLHQFMMLRLFGVDVTEIIGYDFETFIQNHISIDNLTLEEFSEGIDGEFTTINSGTKKYREIILRHLCSRVHLGMQSGGLDESGIKRLPEWDDESESLWGEINKCIASGNFDSYIVNNLENTNLRKWIELEFKNRKITQGQTATNRQTWKGIISENKISPMHLVAWNLMNNVIKNIHEVRNQFTPIDEFYLSIYDALNLSVDISGMRIFHEVLEYSIRDQPVALQTFEDRYNYVTNEYSEVFEKNKDTLPSMLSILGKYWLMRDVDRTSHKFRNSKGASIIGAMIHTSYLMKTKWRNNLRRRESILQTVEEQLTHYFKTSKKGLHLNGKEYWLKYHLQDSVFRDLLAKNLESEMDIYTKQLEGRIPEFLSKLLMMDFVAMTDPNWNSSSRRNPGINGFKPDFTGSSIDNLTRTIVNQCDDKLSTTGKGFFSTYVEDLDKFLDENVLRKEYKKQASKKGNENLDISRFKNKFPDRYINFEIWSSWEWLLYLMSTDFGQGVNSRWTGIHDKQNIDSRKLRKVRRSLLHNYLRLNSGDSYDYIQEQIYKSQYLSIKNDLSLARNKAFIFHANNLLDFCEGSINKHHNGIRWLNVQRIILNHAIKERGYPENYIDWDICYQLFSKVTRTKENDIEWLLNATIENLISGLSHIVEKGSGKRVILKPGLVTIEDLVNYSYLNDEYSGGAILELSSRIKNAHILLNDSLGVDSSSQSNTSKRVKRTYFSTNRNFQTVRDNISAKLLRYVMNEVAHYGYIDYQGERWSIEASNEFNNYQTSQYSGEVHRYYRIIKSCEFYSDGCKNMVSLISKQTHCRDCCSKRFVSCNQVHMK